jgi:hypothetical protein
MKVAPLGSVFLKLIRIEHSDSHIRPPDHTRDFPPTAQSLVIYIIFISGLNVHPQLPNVNALNSSCGLVTSQLLLMGLPRAEGIVRKYG